MKKPPNRQPLNIKLILIVFFTLIVSVTGIIGLSYKFKKPQNTQYIKLKLSQGLWWSGNGNPPIWLAKSIKPGDTEKDLLGNEIATVISRTYYPSEPLKFPNQYDVYVTLKLATQKDRGSEKYRYKRSVLAVGSPISIDLSSTTVTGSIMELSSESIDNSEVTKKITLFNQYGYYTDSPKEYESIALNDGYFDGQNVVFKTTNKYLSPRLVAFSDNYGKQAINQIKVNQNIYVDAEISVKEINGMYFFGEEQRVVPGANLNILTNTQDFTRYTIVSVN